MLTEWKPAIVAPAANIVHVTIGRNIGTEPMTEDTWQAFRTDVSLSVLSTLGKLPDFVVAGQGGEWDGTPEESAIVTTLGTFTEGRVIALQRELERLAGEYGQDAIALTSGQSVLCNATKVPALV